MDEAVLIIEDWSFQLFGGTDASGIALLGFPYVGTLPPDYPRPGRAGQTPVTGPVLILGKPSALSPGPDNLAPLPASGCWSVDDDGYSAIPLGGASPLANMERVARATPSPQVRGRLVALAHFVAAFKTAFLQPGSPSRGDISASFNRVQHLLQALLFDWHPYQHGEDPLALSRFIRQVRARAGDP